MNNPKHSLFDFMFHNSAELLNYSLEINLNFTNKSNFNSIEKECTDLNLQQDWRTVKSKTSNINKVVKDAKMVSCDNRFSVLSLFNEEEKSYDEIQNRTITYFSKTNTKSSSINIKHPHPIKQISKKI